MAEVEKTITINAPVDEVLAYVEEPANVPEYWPSLVEVKDVEPLANGGAKYRWVYKMAGVRIEGRTETTEFVPNQRTVNENKGGVSGVVTWTYHPVEGGTRVDFEAEYMVDVPLLAGLASAFLAKLNENEAESLLANVKAKMEA